MAANYGLKTAVDQHSLDIAAKITPLEVDTAALACLARLQASKADASALTAYALLVGRRQFL